MFNVVINLALASLENKYFNINFTQLFSKSQADGGGPVKGGKSGQPGKNARGP